MNRNRIQHSGRGIRQGSVIFMLVFSFILLLLSVQNDPVLAKPLADAIPNVTVTNPSPVMIGEDFSFIVNFNNTGTDIGYGPFVDLVFPMTSSTGYPGIDYYSAYYLGSQLVDDVQIFPDEVGGTGCVSHPWLRNGLGAFVDVCGRAGDKFVSLLLPFGSFVPGQPALEITVNASLSSLADISPELTIRSRGGYRYGLTPEDDWCCGAPQDIPIAIPPTTDSSDWPDTLVSPQVMTFEKDYVGPGNIQDETASGPNFPRQYTLTVNIASGQTLTNLEIQDVLPDNVQFIGIDPGTTGGYTVTLDPSITNPGEPGGELRLNYASASGTIVVIFDFYIPELYDDPDLDDLYNNPVIKPDTGDDVNSENNAQATATWDPTDSRGPEALSSDTICPTCSPLHTLQDKSIAIQKSVSLVTGTGGGPDSDQIAPGAILEYTLQFQVSDYFSFDNLVVTDIITDGQHVLPSSTFIPTLEVDGNPYSLSTDDINPSNYLVSCDYTNAVTGLPSECTVVTAIPPPLIPPPPPPPVNSGTTTIRFDVSDEIITRSENGRMLGGCVNPTGGLDSPCDPGNLNDGPTIAEIVYRTQILEEFVDDYPSGDRSVDQGDVLSNSVDIIGDVLDNINFGFVEIESDDATAGVTIGRESIGKSIYAIEDEIDSDKWEKDALGRVRIMPGYKVTYRLTYELPTSDVEELTFDDYFPLPVFHVGDPDEDSTTPGPTWTFSPTVADLNFIPEPGEVTLVAPADPVNGDTFYQYMTAGLSGGTPTGVLSPSTNNTTPTQDPVIVADEDANKINIYYADYDDTRNESTTVDLLFSLIVSDDPFADGLYLTNMAHAFEGSTNAGTESSDAIIQFVLNEPVMVSTKGIVYSSNPFRAFNPDPAGPVAFGGPTSGPPRWTGTISSDGVNSLEDDPIDSNISGVDAGDTVTFAITLENQGNSINGAFDIQLKDIIDTDYYVVPTTGPQLNLQVYYGNGTGPIEYDAVDGTCSAAGNGDLCGLELFQEGIELVDKTDEGVCSTHDPNTGNNVIIITYDLVLRNDVIPGQALNTATLIKFAGSEGGPNHLPQPENDDAIANVVGGLEKTLENTEFEISTNLRTEVVIGELVTYTLTATVPEGLVPNAKLIDHLDGGLAFVSCDSVTVTGGLSTDLSPPDFNGVCTVTEAGVSDPGQEIIFNLGNITNSDRDDDLEQIAITYQAIVLNVEGNQDATLLIPATLLNNHAEFVMNEGGPDVPLATIEAELVTVIEPVLQVTKNASPITGDSGDTITFTINLNHAGSNDVTAFDVVLTDVIPADMTYAGSLSCTPAGGLAAPDNCAYSGVTRTITVEWFGASKPFESGYSATIQFDVTLDVTVTPGEEITNTAEVTWTSLAGDMTVSRSTPYNSLGVERTGDVFGPGTAANDYRTSGDGIVTIFSPFAAKSITGTNQLFTAGNNVAIGEQISYQSSFIIPEGTSSSAQLVDTLDQGLAFLSCDNVYVTEEISGSLTTTGSFDCSSVVFSDYPDSTQPNEGRQMALNFDVVTNSDTNNASNEIITVEYTVVVINGGSNDRGDTRHNSATWSWDGNSTTASAPDVTIVEPEILVTKTALPVTGDAGDVITFTIDLQHSGSSNIDAYDVILNDVIPAGMTYVGGSLSCTPAGGLALPDTCSESGGAITVEWFGVGKPFETSHLATIVFQVTLDLTITPTEVITNDAEITWTSLPGDETTPQPDFNPLSVERTGDSTGPGDAANDYIAMDDAAVTVPALEFDKSVNPGSYAIGQIITYDLEITLPEGTTDGLFVFDDIPDGLAYVSHNVDSSGFGGSLNTSPGVNITTGPGWNLELNFGNTITTADGNPNNNSFIVEVLVEVVNLSVYPDQLDGTPRTNTGLVEYSSGPDLTDSVDVWIFDISKTLVEKEHGVTVNFDEVPIGEILTYEVVLTIPHTPLPTSIIMDKLHLIDVLDPGLAYVGCTSISAGNGITTDRFGGDFDQICDRPTVSPIAGPDDERGRQVDFNFGRLEKTGPGTSTLTVRYEVVVLDSLGNQSNSTPPLNLNNEARWIWDDGDFSDQAVGVLILEPELTLTKDIDPTLVYFGQTLNVTLTIDHSSASQTPAYDLVLTDIIPTGLTYAGNFVNDPNQPGVLDDTGAPTIIITWATFDDIGTPSVVSFDVTVDYTFVRPQQITNKASLSWTSLPGDFSTAQSDHNPLSTERFYDPNSNINVYGIFDDAIVGIPKLPGTGFAPGMVTPLPIQSDGQHYSDLDGLQVEIPKLGLSVPIVSVPQTKQGWDLTWLWNQAGWLEGTAYPSWTGNTVITGHAYLSNGLPGPFVDLETLGWGDEIILYANGLRYIYQVRTRELVTADDMSILDHKDQDWLTIFTCKEYSEVLDEYLWRQVVGAVMVDVEQID